MKNLKNVIPVLLIAICIFAGKSSFAQEESASKISAKVTADLVSNYVWRGVNCPGLVTGATSNGDAVGLLSLSPHFQPTVALVAGNFEVGAWGSTDFTGGYKEVDLYATYSTSKFAATIYDYNWNNGPGSKYFNFKNKETGHILEASLTYKGTESFPLSVSVSTMLWGADKKYDKDLGEQDLEKQNYSTYIEFGYALKNFNLFMGVTPADGYYGDYYGGVEGFSVCNLGVSSSKALKINENFSLPLKATLGFNPQAETAYLVFGITF